MRRDQRSGSLRLALVLIGLTVVYYAVAVLSQPGQWIDVHLYGMTVRHTPGQVANAATWLARDALPLLAPGAVAVLGLVALIRGWWRNVLVAALTCVAVVPAAWAIKDVLPRPSWGVGAYPYNTFPSTHVAIVAACGWGIWVLWPTPRGRWLAGALVLMSTLAVFGNVATHAHLPADGMGSILLTAGAGLAACSVVGLDPVRLGRQP